MRTATSCPTRVNPDGEKSFCRRVSIRRRVVRRLGRARVRRPGDDDKETTMRVMVIVKANPESEAGALPSEEMLTAMGRYNEELVKAGVMLAGEGLHPSSEGVRVQF